jgi:hypothetical protein
MALIPSARYPAQIDIDADYPQGKARNAGSFQDGTGTPLEADWLNDVWGFLQAILSAAELTPSGTPDTATVSQYLDGLRAIASVTTSERHLRALMQMRSVGLDGVTPATDDFMAAASTGALGLSLIVKGGTNGVFRVGDESVVATNAITATGLTDCRAIAYNGSNRFVAVGLGATGSAFSTSGTTWTAGGLISVPGQPNAIVWDGTQFIAADGSASRHSTNAVTWSTPTTDINAATGGGPKAIAVLSAGVVLSIGSGLLTPTIARTTDHGATWTQISVIPTTIANPAMQSIVGDGSGEVLALIKDGFDSLVECWASSDGVTWTKRSEIPGHNDGTTEFRALMCQDTGLVIVSSAGEPAQVSASTDRGRTWSPMAFYHLMQTASMSVARGRIFGAGGARIYATDPLVA